VTPRQPICIIRTATVADVPALAAVHIAAWLEAYRGICADSFLDSLTPRTFEGYHRPRFNSAGAPEAAQPFIVACDETGGVIGFARGGPTRSASPTGDPLPPNFEDRFACELYAIYVHPNAQGRGAGRRLFDELGRGLHSLGHQSMCLWVLSANISARNFYERRGGVLAGESVITLDGAAYPQVAYAWEDLAHDP
jgi:ribosomal protein S18 acetylase RimI-like enzyme